MDWLWPGFLILFSLIPLLIAVYIWALGRRRRYAVRYSSLVLVREAIAPQSSLRRHLPFAMFLLALTSLVIALARPVTTIHLPAGQTTAILALDVSLSMCSTDIPPNRLEAAKSAARSFIQRHTPHTQIGIVAFAGYAEVIQPPTPEQDALMDAVDRLIPGRRTAIGSAILKSLESLDEVNQEISSNGNDLGFGGPDPFSVDSVFAPDIIILLTDGASNTGTLPMDAAQQAYERGIRVYTIGFGTVSGGVIDCSGRFQAQSLPESFSGDPQGSGGFRRGIDEATLQNISALTGGEYYSATSADELHEVFRELPTNLVMRQETQEVSVLFAALGALLAALALGLSQIWNPHP
jgi:Ca-activated chloride channel homolog